MIANTTGTRNIAVGALSYDAADTENDNIAIGYAALGGSVAGGEYNVAIGNYAGDAITSADLSVLVGYQAGTAITTGTENMCIGAQAGQSLTTGTRTTLIGRAAGYNYDAENDNLAIGYFALGGVVNGGEFNVAIGNYALDALTSADSNTAVGYNAGSSITTGGGNVFIGHETGVNSIAVDTGTDNILIGFQARANQTNAANQISLGKQITCQGDNNFTFGNGGTDSNIVFGATSITAPSDERYKEEIATSTAGLSFINDLRPVTFKWKKEKDLPSDHESYVEGSDTRVMLSTGETNHGFIAQEVKAAIDAHSEIKDGFKMWSEEQRYDIDGNVIAGGRQRVAFSELIPVLTKAVQELSAQVTTLQNEVTTLKGE